MTTTLKHSNMTFTALANNGTRKVKENLDNMNELQEFMSKMERRGFLTVDVTASKQDGSSKLINYKWNGENWER